MGKKPLQVDEFLEEMNHPMREEIDWLRRLILQADPALTETIKWSAPSFAKDGHDCFTFNFPPKREYFLLVLHRGAVSKEEPLERLFPDPEEILDWRTNDRALLKVPCKPSDRPDEAAVLTILKGWLKATSQEK